MTAILPDAPEILLCRAIMLHLAELELVTYQEDARYGDAFAGPAGFLLSVPAMPDRILTLTPYDVATSPDENVGTVGVQARTRWAGANPRGVLNYSGAIFDALHGMSDTVLSGSVRVSQMLRRSSASMGQDLATKRWSWVDNYYVDMDRQPVTI